MNHPDDPLCAPKDLISVRERAENVFRDAMRVTLRDADRASIAAHWRYVINDYNRCLHDLYPDSPDYVRLSILLERARRLRSWYK